MDQIGQLGHGVSPPSLAFEMPPVQTPGMPLWALIAVVIASIACAAFIASQVRTLRRRKRNLAHWEKDEPLEGVGDWD
jgi:hypothetical protein